MVLGSDRDFEVVIELSTVNRESRLISLEGDTKSYFGSKHHHRAIHVVVHDILQRRFKGLLINHEEEDVLIRTNLYPDVASNEIDLPSHIFLLVIHFPKASFLIDFEK